MNQLFILIKPASSLCNMHCKYCFYEDIANIRETKNYGLMSESTMKNIIDNAFSIIKQGSIHFAFQGGEPTLIGIEYFYSFIEYVNKNKNQYINISYSIQTNGFFINKEWVQLFLNNNFLVGLSFDILESIHNKYRVQKDNGTYNIVLNTKNLFDKYNVQYNILTVLTSELSNYPNEIYNEIKRNNIKYIQFIPCLAGLENNENKELSISPKEFAYFYNNIFPRWKDDIIKGDYISISFFDNISELLAGYIPTTCGINGICHNHIVIESNGNVYPCDFYCIDKYLCGNINNDSIIDIIKNQNNINFTNDLKETNDKCQQCQFYNICHGGCKRMYSNIYVDNDNFCGMEDFLSKNLDSLIEILKLKNIL